MRPPLRQLDNPPVNSANVSKRGRSMNVEPRKSIAVEVLAFIILLWSLVHALLGIGLIVSQDAGDKRPSPEGFGKVVGFFGESATAVGMAFLLSAAVGFLVSMGLRHYQSIRRQHPGNQQAADQHPDEYHSGDYHPGDHDQREQRPPR